MDEHATSSQWASQPPKYQASNIYFQKSLQSETTITKYKGNYGVETNTDPKTGISYPYKKEYDFTSILPISFCGYFICGCKYHFNHSFLSKGTHNQTERTLFFNKMREHKTNTKTKNRNRNYNIPLWECE